MEKTKEFGFWNYLGAIIVGLVLAYFGVFKWINDVIDKVYYFAYDYEKYGVLSHVLRLYMLASSIIILVTAIIYAAQSFVEKKKK